MVFTKKDIAQLNERSIEVQIAQNQIDRFEKGFPFAKLLAPCTIGNGIKAVASDELDRLVDLYASQENVDVIKFVPASGAATRMFQPLYKEDKSNKEIRKTILSKLNKFAFYPKLKSLAKKKSLDLDKLIANNPQAVFDLIIGADGLGYADFPKGLIPFHKVKGVPRTAFEEHLVEAASYGQDYEGFARIHFTVQHEWIEPIRKKLKKAAETIHAFDAEGFELSYSVQELNTDTLAVDESNNPVRDEDGKLVFRPAGHGALLSNLNQMEAELIFIKNIDNVVADKHKYHTVLYKKAMGGLAFELKEKIHGFCRRIEQGRVPVGVMNEMKQFCEKEMLLEVPKLLLDRFHKQDLLLWYHQRFDRPIRVCGMVVNTGEPGGGPFWVEDSEGRKSLQIVESAQINVNDSKQKAILNKSTHFNPVDLVCVIKNHHGDTYDLKAFVDQESGFISHKNYNGKPIKALELPGLWNGSMAHWNTFFIEIPATTFSPVKVLSDLLNPMHQ